MCLNDPEKVDFAKVVKVVYDELDIVPTLPTCCRRSFRIIEVLWSTFVSGSETHIFDFQKNRGQEKVRAISGTKSKKEAIIGTKFDFRKKNFRAPIFLKCAQTTPKRAFSQLVPNLILTMWGVFPHLGDDVNLSLIHI